MNIRPLATGLLISGLACFCGCTTTGAPGDAEGSTLDFPPSSPSRIVKPGESFGLASKGGPSSNKAWKSAVKLQFLVVDVGFEKKTMTERDLEIEKEDIDQLLEHPGVEARSRPALVTFPGQVSTIETVTMVPVQSGAESDPQSIETIPVGLMISSLAPAPSGVNPETPLSEARKHDISLRVLAAINEKKVSREDPDDPVPVVHQYRVERNLILKPGNNEEVGRITRDEIFPVTDKIPVLGDIPLLGRLFRSDFELPVRITSVISVQADWVDPIEIYYQPSYHHTRTRCGSLKDAAD